MSLHISLRFLVRCLVVAACWGCLAGCVTRRTVTSGGQTIEEGYVIKRPLKEAIDNSR